jgi:hypothetical protein
LETTFCAPKVLHAAATDDSPVMLPPEAATRPPARIP